MDTQTAARIFESLSSGTRLGVYRLLVRHAPQGLVAGEISGSLGLASNSASFHLKEMTYAGLLSVTAEGRFQRYRANLALMPDLIAWLTEECCAVHATTCPCPEAPALATERTPDAIGPRTDLKV